MKILHFILGVLMLLFAYFQLNDPDSWLWVAIYLYVGGAAIMGGLGKYSDFVNFSGFGICMSQALQTIPGVIDYITNQDGYTILEGMSNEKPYIELSREFGGILIVAAVFFFLHIQSRKSSN